MTIVNSVEVRQPGEARPYSYKGHEHKETEAIFPDFVSVANFLGRRVSEEWVLDASFSLGATYRQDIGSGQTKRQIDPARLQEFGFTFIDNEDDSMVLSLTSRWLNVRYTNGLLVEPPCLSIGVDSKNSGLYVPIREEHGLSTAGIAISLLAIERCADELLDRLGLGIPGGTDTEISTNLSLF